MENDTYLGEFVAEANAQEFPIKDTLFISVPVGNGKTVFSDKRDYKLFKKSVNVQIYDRE